VYDGNLIAIFIHSIRINTVILFIFIVSLITLYK